MSIILMKNELALFSRWKMRITAYKNSEVAWFNLERYRELKVQVGWWSWVNCSSMICDQKVLSNHDLCLQWFGHVTRMWMDIVITNLKKNKEKISLTKKIKTAILCQVIIII